MHGRIFIAKQETFGACMERHLFVSNRYVRMRLQPQADGCSKTAGHVFDPRAVALLLLAGCCCRSLSRSYRAPTAWHGPCSCCSNLDLEGLQPGMMAIMHSLDELMVYGCFEVRRGGGMGED